MIVGDWGTTRLRLFRSPTPGAEKLVGPGIGQLRGSAAQTLVAMVEPWAERVSIEGVLLCGAAGSRNGLADVPYIDGPAGFADWSRGAISVESLPFPAWIASGLSTVNFAGLPDVMRGEETQVFGLLELQPAMKAGRHVVILPGTHSKWVLVEDERIMCFHTFPTGELFALLRDHSTLTRAGNDPSDHDAGFAAGLEQSARGWLAGLFAARAQQVLGRRTHGWAMGYLSGLLIGGEIVEAQRLLSVTDGDFVVVGDPSLSALYRRAGEALGLSMTLHDGDACVLAGLGRLARALAKETA